MWQKLSTYPNDNEEEVSGNVRCFLCYFSFGEEGGDFSLYQVLTMQIFAPTKGTTKFYSSSTSKIFITS